MAGRGPARPGSARRGLAGPGWAGQGGARQGPAGLGTAGQGKGADGPFLKIERNESNSMTDNCTTPTPPVVVRVIIVFRTIILGSIRDSWCSVGGYD